MNPATRWRIELLASLPGWLLQTLEDQVSSEDHLIGSEPGFQSGPDSISTLEGT